MRGSAFSISACRSLLGGGSLGLGRGSGGSGLGGLLGAAAAGALLRLLRGGEGRLVEVDELDENHLGGITLAEAGVQDPEVSTGTVGDLRSDRPEEFGRRLLVLQVAEDHAAVVGVVVLGLGHEGLQVRLEGLGLGLGGLDPLVQDEGRRHVGEHRLAVTALTTQMIDFSIVSHC